MKTRKRIGAFLLDMFIVMMLAVSLADLNYLNPYKYKYKEATDEYIQVLDEYEDIIGDVSSRDFYKTVLDYANSKIVPKLIVLEKYNLFNSLWYIIIFILYYVVFAYFNNGQTLGKKVFKLKVVDKGCDNVSFLRLFIKGLFTGSSFFYGINIVVILRLFISLISNKIVFLFLFYGVDLISLVFELSLIITLIISKGSTLTSDYIAKTEIIEVV